MRYIIKRALDVSLGSRYDVRCAAKRMFILSNSSISLATVVGLPLPTLLTSMVRLHPSISVGRPESSIEVLPAASKTYIRTEIDR
jgi:hypothetical protein